MIQARYWRTKKPSIENKCRLCSGTPLILSAQSVLSLSTIGTLNQLLRIHNLSSVKLTMDNWSLPKFPSVSRSDWESYGYVDLQDSIKLLPMCSQGPALPSCRLLRLCTAASYKNPSKSLHLQQECLFRCMTVLIFKKNDFMIRLAVSIFTRRQARL